jgi:DUF1680 family protein
MGAACPANEGMVERVAYRTWTGYKAKPASKPDEVRWVQVDLGVSQTIDAVKLYPMNGSPWPDLRGLGFPVRFRVEASEDPEFKSATMIADCTDADYPDPITEIRKFSAPTVKGRYVRVTVTRLRPQWDKPNSFLFALAKLDVLCGGKDIAEGRPITDSISGNLGKTPLTRPERPAGEGDITDNPQNVTNARDWTPVAYQANSPISGVKLEGGPFKTGLENNIGYLLNSFTVDELLRQFRERAGKPNPAGMRKPDPFWEEDLAGSNAARFLMGAGNALRWVDNAELRRRLNHVVDGIEDCRQSNGYIMAYPEEAIFGSDRAGYTRTWVTLGLIEAAQAGNSKALPLLRGFYDWFNQCPYLPRLLRGVDFGEVGMVGSTQMYLSPIGKPEDLQVAQRYFQENYWMDQLAKRVDAAIWQYPYDRPHNYLIPSLEAYLDMYRATGDPRYLDAALGGWDLYRDKWEHVGGSIAICEFDTYPPKSYYLHKHTGELCGSGFWVRLNERLHLLYPDQEKYVNEIEKSIYNVGLANQVGARGIVYHADLEGRKNADHRGISINTCCEGQGTRLLGSLPQYMYSIAQDGLYVNLFEASTITWQQAGQSVELKMLTQFPFKPDVKLRLSLAQPMRSKIRVRVPAWAAAEMPILVNGTRAATGKPGSYQTLDRTWANGDTISFVLPMAFRATQYLGVERVPGQERYALEYGPTLLALVGPMDEKQGTRITSRPEDLVKRLKPKAGEPLHFSIEGDATHEYMPYWQVAEQVFTCYPKVGNP